MTTLRWARVTAVVALALLPSVATSATEEDLSREVVIGVVRDGPQPALDLVPGIERELSRHLRPETRVRFNERFVGDWTRQGAEHTLRGALADPETDIVLVTGLLAGQAALGIHPLSKPVVSSGVIFDGVIDEPIEKGRSAKQNLSFISIGRRVRNDLAMFRDLIGFSTVHVAVSPGSIDALANVRSRITEYEQELGIHIVPVEIAPGMEDSAAVFDAGVEAVYTAAFDRLSSEDRKALFEGLAARKIPTFSMLGEPDVEQGALAALTPEWTGQVVRRTALDLSRIIDGEKTSDLLVALSVDTQLYINATTAARIGWAPTAKANLSAVWVNPESARTEPEKLNVADAMRLAEVGNTLLTVSDAVVAGAEENQYRARSELLPQILADVSYLKADVEPLGDAWSTRGGVILRQSIYDDSRWSAYNSSKQVYASATLQREANRLDVLADAARTFYLFALSEALYRVETQNLAITRENLELARLRRDVGYSGREEILRWESQLAQDQGNVLIAGQDVETTRIALNQVLGLDQQKEWTPVIPEIDDNVFPWLDGRLDARFTDIASRPAFRTALVGYALDTRPEIASQQSSIRAQQIQVSQLERSYFVPSVIAELEWSDAFDADGLSVIVPQDEAWSIRVGASYPIFIGGLRKHTLGSARADLDGLERQQMYSREIVEQQVRTAFRRCEASFPRIGLTRESASLAFENLMLVRDRYSEGLVNVTDLLDAQNQNLIADRQAQSAVYAFDLDLTDLQRAVAWFEADRDDPAAGEFIRAIEARIETVSKEQNP